MKSKLLIIIFSLINIQMAFSKTLNVYDQSLNFVSTVDDYELRCVTLNNQRFPDHEVQLTPNIKIRNNDCVTCENNIKFQRKVNVTGSVVNTYYTLSCPSLDEIPIGQIGEIRGDKFDFKCNDGYINKLNIHSNGSINSIGASCSDGATVEEKGTQTGTSTPFSGGFSGFNSSSASWVDSLTVIDANGIELKPKLGGTGGSASNKLNCPSGSVLVGLLGYTGGSIPGYGDTPNINSLSVYCSSNSTLITNAKTAAQNAAADRAEQERLAKESADKKAADEKAEQERLEKERLEQERIKKEAADKEEAEKKAAAKEAADAKTAQEKAERERSEKETADKKAADEKVEKERLEREASEKAAADKSEAEKVVTPSETTTPSTIPAADTTIKQPTKTSKACYIANIPTGLKQNQCNKSNVVHAKWNAKTKKCTYKLKNTGSLKKLPISIPQANCTPVKLLTWK